MNLILLFDSDFVDGKNRVRLNGRRQKHVRNIHRADVGDKLCVGLAGGNLGQGHVTALSDQFLEMDVELDQTPPTPLPVTLILALPRPNVVKRTLLAAASMGVKKIVFLNFLRVEKSLWQSSSLEDETIREQLTLGLEQSRDTILPEVLLRPRFKPFVEDELPALMKNTLALVAHPENAQPCPQNVKQPVTLIIGPEGGLIDFELQKLESLGFKRISLGQRILRVETAIPYALAKLF